MNTQKVYILLESSEARLLITFSSIFLFAFSVSQIFYWNRAIALFNNKPDLL